MNKTQLQTVLAPLIGALATYLATKFPLLDPPTWNSLVGGVVLAAVAAFLGSVTKKASLADVLGNMPGTTVVTDKKTADALPANNSVVSNSEMKVVNK